MAEVVNLRRARKGKARAERDKQAADNRLAFGRTKAEKMLGDAERRHAERRLSGHRRKLGKDEIPE